MRGRIEKAGGRIKSNLVEIYDLGYCENILTVFLCPSFASTTFGLTQMRNRVLICASQLYIQSSCSLVVGKSSF